MNRTHPRGPRARDAMTLLETVLSLSILGVLAVTLAVAMESQMRLLRVQEGTSGNGIAESTAGWIGGRIRDADQVSIIAGDQLQLTYDTVSGLRVEQIYRLGDRLILEDSTSSEEVAGPISAVGFTDPDGRGVSVSVTVETPSGGANVSPQVFTRVFPLDWIRQ